MNESEKDVDELNEMSSGDCIPLITAPCVPPYSDVMKCYIIPEL